MSIGRQLTLLDLEVEEGRRAARPLKRSLSDKALSLEKYDLSGAHRITDVFECPDWLLVGSIKSGCSTAEQLVQLFLGQAEIWKVDERTAGVELLFAWHFYRDWDECERIADVLFAEVLRAKPVKAKRKGGAA